MHVTSEHRTGGNIGVIAVTQELLLERFIYDPDTGEFTWRVARSHMKIGSIAGAINGRGYRSICINDRLYAGHRLVWLYVHGEWPSGQIDHINGDRADNRLCNLRDVSPSMNMQNQRRARVNNPTGLLGVSLTDANTFVAKIKTNGKLITLGTFENKNDAHIAYVNAKRRLHAGCTL